MMLHVHAEEAACLSSPTSSPLPIFGGPWLKRYKGGIFRARALLPPIHPGRPLAKQRKRRGPAANTGLGSVGSTTESLRRLIVLHSQVRVHVSTTSVRGACETQTLCKPDFAGARGMRCSQWNRLRDFSPRSTNILMHHMAVLWSAASKLRARDSACSVSPHDDVNGTDAGGA